MKLPRKSILPGPTGGPNPGDNLRKKIPLTDDQRAQLDQMQREKDESGPRPPFPPIRPDKA